MFKNLFYFLRSIIISILLFSSSLVFAYGGGCYSPVHMAALLSKPQTEKNKIPDLQNFVRKINSQIRTARKRLNKFESDLADSLSSEKLKADAVNSAGDVRNYIEDGASGWDCATSSSLTPSYLRFSQYVFLNKILSLKAVTEKSFLVKFLSFSEKDRRQFFSQYSWLLESPPLFEILGGILLPQAMAKDEKKPAPVLADCERTGGQIQNDTCICRGPDLMGVQRAGVVVSCQCTGDRTFNKNNKKCECTPGLSWDPNFTVAGVKGVCRVITSDKSTKERTPADEATACSQAGRQWNPTAKTCCQKGEIEQNGKCVNPKNTRTVIKNPSAPTVVPAQEETPAKEETEEDCKKRGKYWKWTTIGDDDVCVEKSLAERCRTDGLKWHSKEKKCCAKGKIVKDGKCVVKEETAKAEGKASSSPVFEERQEKPSNKAKAKPSDKAKTKPSDKAKAEPSAKPQTKPSSHPTYTTAYKKEKQCSSAGGQWDATNKQCFCDGVDVTAKLSDKFKCEQQRCEAKGKVWEDDQCKRECPSWKKDKAFGSKGRVHSGFCSRYASDIKKCKRALSRLKKIAGQISELEDKKGLLQDRISEMKAEGLQSSWGNTEAEGLCFDCLVKELERSKPTTGQNVASVLGMLSGIGLGYIGYRAGASADYHANMLRIQQGLPSQPNAYGFQGLGIGYPWLAKGMYGLTRANTPTGGFVCTPTVSPWGHHYNYQYGQGHYMSY